MASHLDRALEWHKQGLKQRPDNLGGEPEEYHFFNECLDAAGDPATPSDKLHALLQMLDDPLFISATFLVDNISHEYTKWRTVTVAEVVVRSLRNPSLPLPFLKETLLDVKNMNSAWAAWHNPSVQILMLTDPGPEYAVAACAVFTWLQWGRPHIHGMGRSRVEQGDMATLRGMPIGTLKQRISGANEYSYTAPWEVNRTVAQEVKDRRRTESLAFTNVIKKYFPEIE